MCDFRAVWRGWRSLFKARKWDFQNLCIQKKNGNRRYYHFFVGGIYELQYPRKNAVFTITKISETHYVDEYGAQLEDGILSSHREIICDVNFFPPSEDELRNTTYIKIPTKVFHNATIVSEGNIHKLWYNGYKADFKILGYKIIRQITDMSSMIKNTTEGGKRRRSTHRRRRWRRQSRKNW